MHARAIQQKMIAGFVHPILLHNILRQLQISSTVLTIIFYNSGIYIFEALNHGCTAAQNDMQKMTALLNWLSFVTEDLPW